MGDARKKGFHTVPSLDTKEYQRKVREHRIEVLKRSLVISAIVLLIVGGTALYMGLRHYTDYDIRASVDRTDTKATIFAEFCGNILKYSNDGAFYTDHNNEMIWNQTYEMSHPAIDICGKYLAIYDKSGKKIYILTPEGLVHNIETNFPIVQVSVAAQGTVAILMDNQSTGLLELYDKEGNRLVSGAIHGEKGGYPIAIALSDDAIKLAVSMLDINDGSVKTTLAFYNFGSVGENAIDHVVSASSFSDMVIPELDFVSKDRMIAIGDTKIVIFEGTQKPKAEKEIKLEEEVKSVFYNEKYIGTVCYSNEEEIRHKIRMYDMSGRMTMEQGIDMEYADIELLSSNEICVMARTACDIYTAYGVYKFHHEFEEELYCVIPGTSSLNYTFIREGITEQTRLK